MISKERLAELRADPHNASHTDATYREFLDTLEAALKVVEAAKDLDGHSELCKVMQPYRGCRCGYEELLIALAPFAEKENWADRVKEGRAAAFEEAAKIAEDFFEESFTHLSFRDAIADKIRQRAKEGK